MATRPATLADVFGARLTAWYDAQDASTLTTSGGTVSQWLDKSVNSGARTGTAYPLANATTATQPALVASGINGFSALQFASKKLRGALTLTNTAVSVFGICTVSSGYGNNGRLFSCAASGANDYDNAGRFNLQTNSSSGVLRNYRNNAIPGTILITAGSPFLFDTIYDGTNGNLWKDGTVGASQAAISAAASVSQITLGDNNNASLASASEPFTGLIGELGFVEGAITSAERQMAEGILAWKWGTQDNLPANHPNKAAAPTVDTGGGSVTASLAASEAPDTAAATATVATQALMAATEPRDTAAASATITTNASLAASEPTDSAAATAQVSTSATLATTEPADTAAFTSSITTYATLAATEPPDTATATATSGTSASLASTEPTDTASFSAGGTITASLVATEPSDSAAISASAFTAASLAATEPADTITASASATTLANLSSTEPRDTAAFAAGGAITANLAASEAPDTASATATSATLAAFAATEAPDRASVTAAVITSGALGATEPADAAQASGYAATLAALATSEPIDVAAMVGTITDGIPVIARLATTEPPDAVAIAAHVYPLPDFVLSGRFPETIALVGRAPH